MIHEFSENTCDILYMYIILVSQISSSYHLPPWTYWYKGLNLHVEVISVYQLSIFSYHKDNFQNHLLSLPTYAVLIYLTGVRWRTEEYFLALLD